MISKLRAALVVLLLAAGITGGTAIMPIASAEAVGHASGHIVPPGAGGSAHAAKAKALTAFNGAGYYYAGGSQTYGGTDFSRGLGANIFISKPFVPNTPNGGGTYDHSLLDLIVNETTSGVAGNAMEAFVAVEPNVWGNFNPHLGVCAWHNSVDNGCYTGGTNWIDNPANPLNLGADLSADIGTGKSLIIVYASTGCGTASTGWWVQYAGTYVGCYTPAAFGGSTWSTAKFVQADGEYYYNGVNHPGTSNDKPCGDLGNGLYPGTGAGYIASLSTVNPSPAGLVSSFTLHPDTDSGAYSANWTVPGSTTRSIYIGGAGYKFVSGVATLPGTAGSC
jgi:hypothetical protein